MLMRARNLVVTLLVLMLPWQSFAALAISSASHHHDANEIGRLANAGGTQHAHEHHVGDQPRDNAGAPSDHDDGSAAASALVRMSVVPQHWWQSTQFSLH